MQRRFWMLVVVVFSLSLVGQGQNSYGRTEWERYSSEEGRFQILFPGTPAIRPATGKDTSTQTYSASYGGSTFYVAYADNFTEPLTAAALRNRFTQDKDTKLLSEHPVTNGAHNGFELNLQVAAVRMRVRFFLVNQRLYQIGASTSVNLWSGEAEFKQVERERLKLLQNITETLMTDFLNTFKLLPAPLETSPAAKTLPKAEGGDAERPAPKRIQVSGGVLQGATLKKVAPAFPPLARAARMQGAVKIQVTIAENGKVIETEVVSSPALLWNAGEEAARQWVFKPTEVNGVPVKVQGVLVFNFTLQ